MEVVEPLSPGARVFLEPSMNCCILAILASKKPLDVEVIKEGLKHTWIKHPRFSSKVVVTEANKFGRKKRKTIWVRTHVNLDDHVITVVPDLDPAAEAEAHQVKEEEYYYSPDQYLQDYLLKLTTIPMDLSKPLWELHLLNIKTSDAQGIGVLKIHHSIGDGISIVSLVLACTRKTSDQYALPTIPTSSNKKKEKKNNTTSSFGGGVKSCLLWRLVVEILFFIRLLWNSTLDFLLFMATVLFLKDTDSPIRGPPGTEKNPRRIVYQTYSLDDMKLIKNEMNVTINDVMMGLLQSALSRYLSRKYVVDHQAAGGVTTTQQKKPIVVVVPSKHNNILKNIRMRACIMVNVRPSGGIQECGNMMAKGSQCPWGNKMGYIILPLHVALRDNPLDYIRQAKADVDRKKQSLEAKLTYWTSLFIYNLFGAKALADLSYRLVRHTTICFSNVVGPLEEISFHGHPMAYFAATAYGHPQALTIHFQSHADKMTITVSADETVVPDPRQICRDLEESLKQIKNIIIDRRSQPVKDEQSQIHNICY